MIHVKNYQNAANPEIHYNIYIYIIYFLFTGNNCLKQAEMLNLVTTNHKEVDIVLKTIQVKQKIKTIQESFTYLYLKIFRHVIFVILLFVSKNINNVCYMLIDAFSTLIYITLKYIRLIFQT